MVFGVIAYLIAMAMTVYDGLLSLIFQPIIAVILNGIVCNLLLVIASPLLFTPIWRYWRRLWFIPLLTVVGGIACMVLSWHPAMRVQVWHPELQMQMDSFEPILMIGGWLGMLFGVLWSPHLAITKDGRWV